MGVPIFRVFTLVIVILVGIGSPLFVLWESHVSQPDPLEQAIYQPTTHSNQIGIALKTYQDFENTTSFRALWRHLVDCPASLSALCEMPRYEFSKSGNWEHTCLSSNPKQEPYQEIFPSLLPLRKSLRNLIGGKSAASPLTGYPTPSEPIADIINTHQMGCSKNSNYRTDIEKIVAKWSENSNGMPLGFTMTDSKYMDLVEDQYWVSINVVGLSNFFVATYDTASMKHTCSLGIDVVSPTEDDSSDTLRVRTAVSKFKVAQSLALLGATFIFWEMDVFIFRKPIPLLTMLLDPKVDIVVSSHQYSPLEPNIGVFGVRGSSTTALVFQQTMTWTEKDKLLHDQRAFCLVTRLCRNKDHKQSPIDVPLPNDLPLEIKLTDSHHISASVTPRALAGETYALHVLSTSPLQSSMAKSYLAREGRAHPASTRWLQTGQNQCDTKLLAVEGTISLSRGGGYHCTDCVRWTMSWLIALAFVSNRTLILPPIMFDFDFQFAALYLDIESVSQIIPWRETNFLNDPRFHAHLSKCHKPTVFEDNSYDNPAPFNSVDRVSVGPNIENEWKILKRGAFSDSGRECSHISSLKRNVEQTLLNTVASSKADIVFLSPSSLWLPRAPIVAKDGLVHDIYRSLKFCVKGMEHGAARGTMSDTKIGNLCLSGEHKGGAMPSL